MSGIDQRDQICDHLLARAGRGDREAFGELFTIEAGRLIAISRRIVRRRELAEEAVQDSFVAAWLAAPRFDPAQGRARAWLATIVRNRSLNIVRDGSRVDLASDDELQGFRDRSDDAYSAHAALAEGDSLRNCLEQLDAPRRKSILLAYVVGYSHGEIAAELNAPLGTVKAWIRRGMLALQECMS